MNNTKGFKLGLRSYVQAISFIFRNYLAWCFLFPLVLNVVLFSIGFYSIAAYGNVWIEWLDAYLGTHTWDFWGSDFLTSTIDILMYVIIRVLFFLVYAYFGGYVILILMAPVFAWLSERTEGIVDGVKVPFKLGQFVLDVGRGIVLAIRNLFVELVITALLVVLSFVPGIGLFTSMALLIVSSYFYGFSFMDYTLERKRLNVRISVTFIRANKGLAIGNGLVFALVLIVPWIGVTLAGFISIISVVSATLSTKEALKNQIV